MDVLLLVIVFVLVGATAFLVWRAFRNPNAWDESDYSDPSDEA